MLAPPGNIEKPQKYLDTQMGYLSRIFLENAFTKSVVVVQGNVAFVTFSILYRRLSVNFCRLCTLKIQFSCNPENTTREHNAYRFGVVIDRL